ncbi:ERF family protein [Bilophila wadsworthia]|uniref:ERF family protein n=1 Tax=Bilophila wadsworthia TaxID=35833 RepID=UPI00399C6A5D
MESFCSDQIRELAQALIKVQEQLQPATKDANNPFTKSKYATLNSIMDSCRDALLSNGIWLCQYPVPTEPGYLGLVTKLTHAESGQWQSSLAVVPLPKADPQGVGISMTYIRRYALSAMLGIVTEEDTDGEFTLDKLNRPQKQKNAVNASQGGKTTWMIQDKQKISSPQIGRQRTFPIASLGEFIRNRIGTGWSGVHPRHRKHGSEKGTAFGGGFHWNPQRKIWWKYVA